jgi:Predicted membrane protein (DUF2306)
MALMTGPLQILPRFRESNWNRHRLLGWINCGAVLLGCCASVWMVPHAQTGWIAAWGFLTLGAAWIVNDRAGCRVYIAGRWATAPAADASQLRAQRCRHHAADLPAPCFRVLLTVCDRLSRIAWLCWIPNVIAVELYLHVVPTPSGITLPGRLEFRSRVFRTLWSRALRLKWRTAWRRPSLHRQTKREASLPSG